MADNKLFSVETEAIVLANLLQNPNLIHSVNGLKFYMFSSLPHQFLFQEFEDLKEKQLTPDPSLVIASLESKNELDKVGGKKYIDILMGKDTTLDEASFKEYLSIVIASYKGRTFISTLSSIHKDELNSSNIDEKVYETRKKLDALIEMQENVATFHVGAIVQDTYEEIIARMSNPGIRGVTWGVKSIDLATGGKSPGDLVTVAGRPGSGKTALVCNSILADAEAGVPSLLIEREMRKQEMMERLISIDTGIPGNYIQQGILNQERVDKIKASLEKMKKLPIYLDVNFLANDPLYIESTINKFRNKHGIQNVYLDYVQIATERDDGQTQSIGRIMRLMKLMANDLGICNVVLSQLNRKVEERDDKRPVLSDMKQSGAIEEDSDFVIGLYRDEYYNKETKYKNLMEYIVLKHRNGPTGTVTVKFDGPTYKISEA